MSRLEELIQELCPDGVEYRPLWEVTIWDKRFNSVDRYKQPKIISYPYLLAKDLFSLQNDNGDVFLLSTGEQTGWTTEEIAGDNLCEGEVVTIPWGKSRKVIDVMKYYKGKFVTADNRIATSIDTDLLLNKFLFYWMQSQGDTIDSFYRGSGLKHPSMKDVLDMQIPVPPVEIQREIVRILDNFTELKVELTEKLSAELTARKQQYEYYREKLLNFNECSGGLKDLIQELCPDGVEYRKLEDCCTVLDNKRKPVTKSAREAGDYPYYGANGIQDYVSDFIFEGTFVLVGEDGSVVTEKGAPIVTWASGKIWVNNHAHIISEKDDVSLRFLFHYLQTINVKPLIHGNIPKLTGGDFRALQIPVPPHEVQREIVRILDNLDSACSDLTSGLPAEIESRQKQYEYYRDKLLTFKVKEA